MLILVTSQCILKITHIQPNLLRRYSIYRDSDRFRTKLFFLKDKPFSCIVQIFVHSCKVHTRVIYHLPCMLILIASQCILKITNSSTTNLHRNSIQRDSDRFRTKLIFLKNKSFSCIVKIFVHNCKVGTRVIPYFTDWRTLNQSFNGRAKHRLKLNTWLFRQRKKYLPIP